MIIVCTGGRDHDEPTVVEMTLLDLNPKGVIVGDCSTGVDLYVRTLCDYNKILYTVFKADWSKHGKSAGPLRNKEMVKMGKMLGATLVAFKGGKGTANCIKEAENVGLTIMRVE